MGLLPGMKDAEEVKRQRGNLRVYPRRTFSLSTLIVQIGKLRPHSVPGTCKVIQYDKGQARSSPLEVPGGEKSTGSSSPSPRPAAWGIRGFPQEMGPEGRSHVESSLLPGHAALSGGRESGAEQAPGPGLTTASYSNSRSSREGGSEGRRCRRPGTSPHHTHTHAPSSWAGRPAASHFSFQQPSRGAGGNRPIVQMGKNEAQRRRMTGPKSTQTKNPSHVSSNRSSH